MACKFCDTYYDLRREHRKFAKKMQQEGNPVRSTIRACIQTDTYRLRWHTHAGRTIYRPMPLNYCPMCGKQFRKG